MFPRARLAWLAAPLIAVLLPAFFYHQGSGLPLFARKYEMPCTNCHIAFPKLNAFGMQFRQNGYRMPGALGTPVWQDKIFPLSLVASVGYDFTSMLNPPDETGKRVRFNTSQFRQNAVEFHSAGTLGEHLTFHFDNNFAGIDSTLLSGMAFIQLDDIGSRQGMLNLKAGIYDAELPYLASSRRTTAHDYLAPVTLDGRGIELNGALPGWMYAAAVINSSRTAGSPSSRTLNNFENFYAWAVRDILGHKIGARVFLDREDPRPEADDTTKNSSRHLQVDVSAFLNFGSRVYVTPAFTYEKRSDTLGLSADMPAKRLTGMLEGLFLLDPAPSRLVLTARYELQHDDAMTGLFGFPEVDHSLATVNLSYFLTPNCRVGLDWARDSFNRVDLARVDEFQAYLHIGY